MPIASSDSSPCFDTVQIPSLAERDASQDGYFKDPLAERASIDYALFYRTFIPDAIAYTAGLIKRLTGNHCLVGIMYGYNLKMNSSFPRPAATGCFGLGEALRIEAVDAAGNVLHYWRAKLPEDDDLDQGNTGGGTGIIDTESAFRFPNVGNHFYAIGSPENYVDLEGSGIDVDITIDPSWAGEEDLEIKEQQ